MSPAVASCLALLVAAGAPAFRGPLASMLERVARSIPPTAAELSKLALPESARPCLAFEVLTWLAGADTERMTKATVARLGADVPVVRFLPPPSNGPICDPAGPCDCGMGRGNPMCASRYEPAELPGPCWRPGFQELLRAYTGQDEAVRSQAYERALARGLGQEPPPLQGATGLDVLALAEPAVDARGVSRRPRCTAVVDAAQVQALVARLKALAAKPDACR